MRANYQLKSACLDGQFVGDEASPAAVHHARGGGERRRIVGLRPRPEALHGREPAGQMRRRHRGEHRSNVFHDNSLHFSVVIQKEGFDGYCFQGR